jgi:serine/threonine protein kinase
LHVNETIGNYRIISHLASGTFGRVYLAQHLTLTKRKVAIKILQNTLLNSEEERNAFLQEAHYLEMLQHTNILPILDVGLYDGVPYLMSEYAAGGSLRQRLQQLKGALLPLEQAFQILSQIGQALSYAHQQNIIHRDIKPENILFDAHGNALLADFGLAIVLATASAKDVSNAGTPNYMAPEMFRGSVSKESDQYALACIAYELFTGQRVFTAPNPMALMFKHVTEAPVPPRELNSNIPLAVEHALLKALSKQRQDRYSNVDEFIAALGTSIKSDSALTMVVSKQIAEAGEDDGSTVLAEQQEATRIVTTEKPEPIFLPEKANLQPTDEAPSLPSDAPLVTNKFSTIHEYEAEVHSDMQPGWKPVGSRRSSRHKWTFIGLSGLVALLLIGGAFQLLWPLMHLSASHASTAQTAPHPATMPTLALTPTFTAVPTLAPTPTTTSRSTLAPAPTFTAVSVLAPAPTSAPNPTPKPAAAPKPTPAATTASMTYILCGDAATSPDISIVGPWNHVANGETVNRPTRTFTTSGYSGLGHNVANSNEQCDGSYQYGLDQNSLTATWTWSNATLHSGNCNIFVYIPTWYAGAPDAQYVVDTSTTQVASFRLSQDPSPNSPEGEGGNVWVLLGSVPLPTTGNAYSFIVKLYNGNSNGWYLGADAIKFECQYATT